MNDWPCPTPETAHFWNAIRSGQLVIDRCGSCGHVAFPPRGFCPKCLSEDVGVLRCSGRATLYSYVINHRPPAIWGRDPISVALIRLEEGPLLLSTVMGVDQTPQALKIDMPLQVIFHKLTDAVSLPVFVPAMPDTAS
ncbi:MAG: zinc ribbon domain-containing protein [Steroidobacteraceae bacterium]